MPISLRLPADIDSQIASCSARAGLRKSAVILRKVAPLKTLADSGYFIGLFNPKGHHHARCQAFLATCTGLTITTWAVFVEVCTILNPVRQKAFFAWSSQAQVLGYLRNESPPADAVATLWDLMARYDNLPMDFCDATPVYFATHLETRRIATVDVEDFSVYRLPDNKPFAHVLDSSRQSRPSSSQVHRAPAAAKRHSDTACGPAGIHAQSTAHSPAAAGS